MSSETPNGTSNASPLTSRSLLSRLRSPLQSKSRNFSDFYIQPDDPHRQYAPGDVISGSVILKVLKPLRITHLAISLHGYAQVFKNPNSPGDAYKVYSSTASGKGKKSGNYFGNGFASLFEDEAVLCGEGRLGEGVYHFNFELDFPSKGLPSSIDFERGTVTYMLTSTLTRPTTISPVSTCEAKVTLVASIDIAPVPSPKARIISLEAVSRRSRARPRKRSGTSEAIQSASSEPTESSRNGRVSDLASVTEESDGPGSPAPSYVSFESHISSGNASGTEYGLRSINTAPSTETGSNNGSRTTLKGKTITATIEMTKGGFLRGDQIPVRIAVNHTKHVRSLKGIIITLYRQARVDMHPALPVLPHTRGDKVKSEDYYPKSRTGLGGLSLSSAGSSHLFRKDLSQSFAPLFVDPRTLTAEVKCAVRVPDEAFPTMANVPGAMISFRYFVEVVVDIQGKLSRLDRMFPNAGLISIGPAVGAGTGRADETAANMFTAWGGNFADTDSIRREKGVVSCLFEVVIGTKDSDRNGKKRQKAEQQPTVHDLAHGSSVEDFAHGAGDENYYEYDQEGNYYDPYGYDGFYHAPGYQEGNPSHVLYHPTIHEDEEGISEKERLQREEARLLPSQPPDDAGPSSPSTTQPRIPASAPVLPEEDDPSAQLFAAESSSSSSSSSRPPPPFAAAARTTPIMNHGTGLLTSGPPLAASNLSHHIPTHASPAAPSRGGNNANHTEPLPSSPTSPSSTPAPGYFPSTSSHVQPTDDKEELRRRRLEMEASAPEPQTDSEEDVVSASGTRLLPPPQSQSHPTPGHAQNLPLPPSAPVLDDEDEELVGAVRPGPIDAAGSNASASREGDDVLPSYQR